MRSIGLIVVAIFLGGCGGLHPTPASKVKIVTVCELFADLPSHQDKIVAVRGIFFFGLRQDGCPERFISGNHQWPTVLDLVHSNYPQEGERTVDFVTDDQTWNHLELLAAAEGKKGRHEEIWATIEGQLQGPQRYLRPGVRGGVGGYGHLGGLAAQLVVKRVDDIEIKQSPTYDYSEMVRPHL